MPWPPLVFSGRRRSCSGGSEGQCTGALSAERWSGGSPVAARGQVTRFRTGRAPFPAPQLALALWTLMASTPGLSLIRPNMSSFLEHFEFLISSPQDHLGDRALDRWTSCVRMPCALVQHTLHRLTLPQLPTSVSRY